MNRSRSIREIRQLYDALEGAGVRLRRGFSFLETELYDPFLLFDDFSSERKEDHIAGFPFHPHRGIETVTYLKAGSVVHRDSLNNTGTLSAGDVQWMTAGSGIIHEEMPGPEPITGFQLWINLPAHAKRTRPAYREVPHTEIPTCRADGSTVAVIAGSFGDVHGAIEGGFVAPLYLDSTTEPDETFTIEINPEKTVFLYVMKGSIVVEEGSETTTTVEEGSIVLFDRDGDRLRYRAGADGSQVLLVAGTPLREPIAWHGPIVMNTDAEIREALKDLREGTFIKEEVKQ